MITPVSTATRSSVDHVACKVCRPHRFALHRKRFFSAFSQTSAELRTSDTEIALEAGPTAPRLTSLTVPRHPKWENRASEVLITSHFHELKRFIFVPSLTDFTSVGETLGVVNLCEMFSSVGQKCQVQQSRLVNLDEIKGDNAILLGGNQAWSGRVLLNKEGFQFQNGVIYNRNPNPANSPYISVNSIRSPMKPTGLRAGAHAAR